MSKADATESLRYTDAASLTDYVRGLAAPLAGTGQAGALVMDLTDEARELATSLAAGGGRALRVAHRVEHVALKVIMCLLEAQRREIERLTGDALDE